jgi:hypothetical protein
LEKEEELLAGEVTIVGTPRGREVGAGGNGGGTGTVKGTGTPKGKEPNGKGIPARKEEPRNEKEKSKKRNEKGAEQPIGTGNSAKDAKEVEEVVGILDGDGDAMMDVDEDGAGMDMPVDGDEGEDEVSPSKLALKQKLKARKSRGYDDDDEEEEEEERPERPKSRLIRRAGGRKDAEIAKMKEKEKEKEKKKERKRDEPLSSKEKAKPRRITLPESDDDPDFEILEIPTKPKPAPKTKTKTVPPPPVTDDTDTADSNADEDDDGEEPAKKSARTSISKGKGKAVDRASPVRTPKRVVSVVIPTVSSSKKKTAPPTRTESLRIKADEAPAGGSSSKRARPTKGRRGPDLDTLSGRHSLESDNEISAALPQKRSALIKATNHLHNVAMPDLMSYVQEKKRGFKRKESDRISDRGRDPSIGKERKRPSIASSNHPSSDEEEPEPKKRRRISEGVSKKKLARVPAASDDDSEMETRPRKISKKVRLPSSVKSSDESADETVVKGKGSVMCRHDCALTDSTTIKALRTTIEVPGQIRQMSN